MMTAAIELQTALPMAAPGAVGTGLPPAEAGAPAVTAAAVSMAAVPPQVCGELARALGECMPERLAHGLAADLTEGARAQDKCAALLRQPLLETPLPSTAFSPNAPTTSAQPTLPAMPTASAQPTLPTMPTASAQPTMPTDSAQPSMPTIPADSAQQAMPTDPSLSASSTSRGNGPSVPVQGKDRRVENEVAVLAAMPQMAMPTEISVASSSPSVSASVLLPEAVREIARRENLSLAVTELCETMEVRHGALLGEGEVRLTLQPTVLSGSVVRRTCERGEVAVHFAAATEQVERLLLAAQPMLLARLAESTPLPVSMTVARGLAEEDFRRRS